MTDNKLMVLPDVQSSADRRNIPIRRVGVKGIRTPILVKSQSGAQHTVADVEMYVSLPADKKGTHMSRFWTLLGGINKPFAPQMMVEVMQEMLASLKSDGGYIRLAFPFFMEKSAPVSHLQSTMDYDVVLTAECADGKITVTQEVIAPVTSLCPCSKEISKYGAHNQRSHVSITAELETNLPIEKQIEMIESCASCQVWGLLKRSDEKYVTEHAYENPKFVEDLVRDVAIRCQDEPAILAFTVEAENFESIHNHSAFASLHFDKRQTAE
ncbi:GTP cyclohydrolase FolE2 [Parasutterella excrementihominis]|uniref:GTP cyclohydrolase FolE2 n=1 Tax=Parasutterella excrementihominis TaxID=487175 RepID=UPI003A8E3E1A